MRVPALFVKGLAWMGVVSTDLVPLRISSGGLGPRH